MRFLRMRANAVEQKGGRMGVLKSQLRRLEIAAVPFYSPDLLRKMMGIAAWIYGRK